MHLGGGQIYSATWRDAQVKCCNNALRLINQDQMHKNFPKVLRKTNNIISRLHSSIRMSPHPLQKQAAYRQFRTLQFVLIWLMSLGIFHFNRLCLLNLCNQCELCLRPVHVCFRACSVHWGLQGEMALSRHHDSLISCFPPSLLFYNRTVCCDSSLR